MAKPVLAGGLALLLVAAATLSVCHSLHRSLHDGVPGNEHFCLVCTFAKGQVSAAEVALLAVVLVFCVALNVRVPTISPLPGSDYRLSPSRAPPCR